MERRNQFSLEEQKTNLKKSTKCYFNKPLGIRLPQEHKIIPASHRLYYRLSTCEAQFYLGLIRQPETKSFPNVSSNPPLKQFIPNERGVHHTCLPPPSFLRTEIETFSKSSPKHHSSVFLGTHH
ncbi:hypothetical protein CDAR_480911 [Caerostris darwini]|uniref:Uncharacterized protein n=1 Tax=Caerostris darwini TaxID=1538125 RepID=A0AAV4SRX9_9ARAC|nr:hypothetical protein CDAR_480911 [Caerostris darwini]